MIPDVLEDFVGSDPRSANRHRWSPPAAQLSTANYYSTPACQSAEVHEAIARSDGTRRSVLEQLRQTRVENGVLGSFSFDARGDRSPRVITVERVERGRYVFDSRISVPETPTR
ncbi:MAG TPA: hypothetical protein VLA87_01175 [Gaiellaceae bacterium]|nr:hypothetical protein [Gaiellaceae bacterium]